MEAVRNAANPPPMKSSGNAIVDKANAEAHARIVAAQREADERERIARDNAKMHGFTNILSTAVDVTEGVTGGVGGMLLDAAEDAAAAAAAAAALAAAKAAEELVMLKRKEEEEAAAAAARLAAELEAAKQALYAKLKAPVACDKKLSTESSYHPRFIWINDETKEFHWSKTNDTSKSKCINIKSNIKSVSSNSELDAPNITIELQNAESVFSAGLFGAIPTTIDIKMEDAGMNNGFIKYLQELMK